MSDFEDLPPPLTSKEGINNLEFLNTSPIEVAKIIRLLKKSSFSHCGVPGKFIALISTPVSFSMSRLFNNFFEIGYFPEIWKIAHITPIIKDLDLNLVNLVIAQFHFFQHFPKYLNQLCMTVF